MSNRTGGRNGPQGRVSGSSSNVSSGRALSMEKETGRQATTAGSSAASFPSSARRTTVGAVSGSLISQENTNEVQDERKGKPAQERKNRGSTRRGGPDDGVSSLQPPPRNASSTSTTGGSTRSVYKGNGEGGAAKRGDLKTEDYPPQHQRSSTFPGMAPASVAASRTPSEDDKKKMPYLEQDEGKRRPPPQDQQYATFPGMAATSVVAGRPTQDEEKKHVKRFEGEPRASSSPPQDQQYSMFPALAEPSVATPGTPPQDKKKQYSKIDGKGRPSDGRLDIIQQHDDTVSQMRDTEVVTQSMPQGNQDGDSGGNGGLQSSPPSTRPSGLVPLESPARVGAGNTGWESSAKLEPDEQLSSPEPRASSSYGQDRTVVANAITADDLYAEFQEKLEAEAVTAEVVSPNRQPPFYKTRPFLAFVGFLILAAIAGTIGGIFASRSDSGSPLTASPTRAPTTSIPTVDTARPTMGPMVDPAIVSTVALVEENSFDGGSALKNSSSPQYKALDWLLNNALLSSYSNQTKLQRFALAALYFSTNGTGWTRSVEWMSDFSVCRWFGKFNDPCSDGDFISTLRLTENNLVGTLPPELAILSSSLVTIDLDRNSLSGSIPTTFGSLTNLEILSLFNSSLNGSIPSEIGALSNRLERLILSNNTLTGAIPSEIGRATRLQILYLWGNYLYGSIPTEIGQLSNLVEEGLSLSRNKLTGTIPSVIGRATSLKLLSLFNNNLNGSIPTEIGKLSNSLEQLSLSNNTLTGTIPSEIGRLTSLQDLWLDDNKFNGPIPSEIGRATSLAWLHLYNNKLTGTIPSEIGRATSLGYLELDNNKLTGTIPSEINGMTDLDRLFLYNNAFTPPFACPDYIEHCYVSCIDWNGFDSDCREL